MISPLGLIGWRQRPALVKPCNVQTRVRNGLRATGVGAYQGEQPSVCKATKRPQGLVNSVRVRCGEWFATLYVDPAQAKRSGDWQCPHCKTRH
jgi:hypothetical protein